jgi:hypothetical protein
MHSRHGFRHNTQITTSGTPDSIRKKEKGETVNSPSHPRVALVDIIQRDPAPVAAWAPRLSRAYSYKEKREDRRLSTYPSETLLRADVRARDRRAAYMRKRVSDIPVLYDLDERFRVMDRFADYRQVLTLASPPIETLGPPPIARDLASFANDELAGLCARFPDRFVGLAA